MSVYGEVLFAENCITGAVILLLTGKLSGYKPHKVRIAAGSVMCGIYSFILFVPLSWYMAVATKLIFSVVAVMAVYGAGTWRSVIKNAGVFYTVSFLMGGVTVALMYMTGLPFMTANGSFVLKGVNFVQITAGVAVTWYLGSGMATMLKEKRLRENVIKEVEIYISGKMWKMKALIDTGNFLKDPLTGYPVAVVSKSYAETIKSETGNAMMKKLHVIPYKSVGRSGLMYGVRAEKIVIDDYEGAVVVAFADRDFSPWRSTEKYDLLLNQQFFKGEEFEYDEKSGYARRHS